MAYVAVCLNLFLGLRVGELIAIRESDIQDDSIVIRRQMTQKYVLDSDMRFKRKGQEEKIPKWESTGAVALTPHAMIFLDMIHDWKKRHGIRDENLLINMLGSPMHSESIDKALRTINKEIDTIQKGKSCTA